MMRLPIALVLVLAAGGGGVAAQQGLVDVEVEPITCWWRSSTSAVRSGEPFTLLLTCAVVETETTRVVPDQSRLDPSVVQLEPFEVIGGSHAPDMQVPGKRFFQYEYRLRLINESAFGGDVDVPELEIGYRIESSVARGESVQGRDLKYNLQPISIRLLSLVPSDTMDIREAPAAEFAAVEARESRSALLRLIATILFVLAGVVLLVMAVRMLTRGRQTKAAERWRRSPSAIASAVTRELSDVRQQSRGGWDADLAGRALAAARIAATLVNGHAPGQARAAANGAPVDGQLLVKDRLGRGGALVSGSATAETAPDAAIAQSLRTLTVARYGRAANFDSSALDEALDTAMATAGRAASEHSWLKTMFNRSANG
jgi:hypothetical protein